jgi:uncharacterized phage protein gp47/JayE
MPITPDGYEQRTEQTIYDSLATTFRNETTEDVPVRDYANVVPETATPTLVEATLLSQARLLASQQEESLQQLFESGFVESASGQALTRRARDLGVERRPAVPATGVVEFSSGTAASSDITIPTGTVVQTDGEDPVRFETITTATIQSGTSTATATVEALEGGEEGNLGPNTLEVMPSPPSGIQSVTNPNATGVPSLTDTTGDALVPGRDREGDESLRDRVLRLTATGGSGTRQSIVAALREVDDVRSVQSFENTTNTSQNSLPETSGEFVVFGGTDLEVGRAIFETAPFTGELVNGVNGTATTANVDSETLDQTVTVRFSRPSAVSVALTVDLRVDETYAGDAAIKDTLVDVIGGTDTDGATVVGEAAVGQRIYVQTLEDAVIGDNTGVIGVASSTADTDGDSNDDTTTVNGLQAIPASDGEILQLDAADITVTTTEI